MPTVASRGLADIVASPSSICFIDGEKGILAYGGYDIHDLAERSTFEETAFLLWNGRLPKSGELQQLQQELRAAAAVPAPLLDLLRHLPPKSAPMDLLRTAVSALALYDPEAGDMSTAANQRKARRLVAQTGTLIAAFDRIRNGKQPIAPAPDLNLAGNFLYMLSGERPSPTAARSLDIALILHADHEFNASTFAARVTAATLSDIYSAVTSALGALKGPLHGGANEAVIHLLLKIGNNDPIAFIKQMFAEKKKVPGFGHRVYRTEDPRATHLRQMSRELGERTGNTHLYKMSRQIEEFVKAEKGLNPNVDFYSASMYYDLGIPVDLFTPIFAFSRMSGWTAHVLEQYSDNRLIRPRSEYTGPTVPQHYVAIDQR